MSVMALGAEIILYITSIKLSIKWLFTLQAQTIIQKTTFLVLFPFNHYRKILMFAKYPTNELLMNASNGRRTYTIMAYTYHMHWQLKVLTGAISPGLIKTPLWNEPSFWDFAHCFTATYDSVGIQMYTGHFCYAQQRVQNMCNDRKVVINKYST